MALKIEKQYYTEGTEVMRALPNKVLFDENDRVYVSLHKDGRIVSFTEDGFLNNDYKLRFDGRKFSSIDKTVI